jgi:hypothetical protein
MADLDTASKRTSSVGLLLGWLLAPPIPDGTLGAGDRQHVAWSYSGIAAAAGTVLAFILDMNTRMLVYLRDLYSAPTAELTSLTTRYLAAQTGEMTARVRKLQTDATDAMT